MRQPEYSAPRPRPCRCADGRPAAQRVAQRTGSEPALACAERQFVNPVEVEALLDVIGAGSVIGAAIFTWLRDEVARRTDFWRAVMGAVILLIVLLFPQGLVGGLKALTIRWRELHS